jgi:hypothetical protein
MKPFSFAIKVDGQNGNAQDFLLMTNMLDPGDMMIPRLMKTLLL